ncbi:hypothetical protein MMC07_000517 [Pseudocyphellaria aurata]|nr:hypothetical protein [Pseudocyphellaria aurata]
MSHTRVCQGVFAVNKPKSLSSAQVLRELQRVFKTSKFFAPWLEAERALRASHSKFQQRRRRDKRIEVKLGHGGTLDPMATGVLVVGVGNGTKHLKIFLECTKAYDATVLFGAATDTHDCLGKVLSKAPYGHVTEDAVGKALSCFRGTIMQRPPLYSALRIQGKRLYEYAREGKEVPVEIQERQVEVKKVEIIEWLKGENHNYEWPSEEAEEDEKRVTEKILHKNGPATAPPVAYNNAEDTHIEHESGSKRKFRLDEDDELVTDQMPASKRRAPDPKLSMSGALQSSDEAETGTSETVKASSPVKDVEIHGPSSEPFERPPAVKLRMTVTSGFYVRSLSHDLGKEVGSFGIMSELVRTQQGPFTLGHNVLEFDDFKKGEEIWAPKMESVLEEWEKNISSDDGENYVDEEQSLTPRSKDQATSIETV